MDVAIARLADRQHGVISLEQLLGLGLSASAVRSRVRTGRLHPIHRGVYAVGRRSVSRKGRWMAAVMACGAGASLSHSSSVELWTGIRASGRKAHVTTPTHRRSRDGIIVHFSGTLVPADVTARDGIPCTSPARTLLDYATEVGPRRLRRAVDELERLRIFDRRAVEDVLARTAGHRGAGPLKTVLAEWAEPPFTRSEAERRVLQIVEREGFPWPLVNAWVAGYEVDLFWPEQRLVVEIDGFESHRTRQAFERDRVRDADLGDAGFRVIRVTWRQIEDPARLAGRLRRALA